ncbi:MAG: hypothetical protein JXB47_13640 [Anaerolineae bacterium]|nr:hypothetical protein [Anaerolineae bacterium]
MFDVMEFVTVDAARSDAVRTWYEADPNRAYPAVIARIRAALELGGLPEELIDRAGDPLVAPGLAARNFVEEARAISPGAWDDALAPRASLGAKDHARRAARRAALELARKWFTAALRAAAGQPVGLHILKTEGAERWEL